MIEWRPVPGFEGLYEVSDDGQVRSLSRRVAATWGETGLGFTRFVPGQIIKSQPNQSGHHRLYLSRDGKRHRRSVHRLVLEAFVGPRPDGHVGCHRDGNPADNTVGNLYWGTQSQNRFDAVRHGVDGFAKRDRCKNGHRYTPENTYHSPAFTGRRCKKCDRERYLARKRAA